MRSRNQAKTEFMKTNKSQETPIHIKKRLEFLRGELRNERISYWGLCELQSLAAHIPKEDVELREAAGLPEN